MQLEFANSTDLLEKLRSEFISKFGDADSVVFSIAPASFVLSGDHTQYNDGLMISAAVNSYIGIAIRKNDSAETKLVYNGMELEEKQLLDMILETDDNVTLSLSALLNLFQKRDFLNSGFSCLIINNSSKVFGLGNSAALGTALVSGINEAFSLKLNQKQIIDICLEADKSIFDELVNPSLYCASLGQHDNSVTYYDTRTKFRKYLDFDTKFKIVLCNTNQLKPNFRELCKDRIEECKIGTKGLRLYIWGIKNLRDVEEQFLYRHENMIPKRLFVRCVYNVKARKMAELGYKHLKENNVPGLGKTLFEIQSALENDYELSSPMCTKLVKMASELGLTDGSKMLSCSYYNASLNIVSNKKVEQFTSSINQKYHELTGKELETKQYEFCEGVKIVKEKNFVEIKN